MPRHPASWPDIPPVRTTDLEGKLYKQCKMVMILQDGDDGGNMPNIPCNKFLALIISYIMLA